MRRFAEHYPFVKLASRGTSQFDRTFVFYVVVAGLGNALVLAIVNSAASQAMNADVSFRYFALFCLAVSAYLLSQYQLVAATSSEMERVLDGIRTSIAEHIARAEFESLDHIGRAEIFGVVTRETTTISQAAPGIAMACQSALMIFFSAIYLAHLSVAAFGLTVLLTLVGVRVYLERRSEAMEHLEEAARQQGEFFDGLTHLLDGFKEVRLHEPRARAIVLRLREISGLVRTIKAASERSFAEQYAFAQVAFYLQIGGVVFLLPRLVPTFPAVVMQATAAVLFIIGPLSNLVVAIPAFERANAAAKNVVELEGALARAESVEAPAEARTLAIDQPIELRRVRFRYAGQMGEPGFGIGPISLTIRPRQIVFVVGGNGSGKSTLLKVLTGLYQPQEGSVLMGRTLLTSSTAAWYRSHFTAIFADYHLFDRLYGLDDVEPEAIEEALRLMDLATKVHVDSGRFSTLELSSGQRKRLALVVALLERRPVLVVDEWAAEQDPAFRQVFYSEILPWLRDRGKTIIAATHDDRYFGIADEVVKLEYGAVVGDEAR